MPPVAVSSPASDASGIVLVAALVLPLVGILLTFLVAGRYARGIALILLAVGLAVAAGIADGVWRTGHALTYTSGGWLPPLGVKLRADGLSAVMIAVTAIIMFAVGLYAPSEFRVRQDKAETRRSFSFWILLFAIWVAMNAVFLGNDLFNLYVALELVTFAAVPLVSISGTAGTLRAALRYLLFALIGSVLYLLGTALLYGNYGTLDISLLSERIRPGLAVWLSVSVMTAGLAAKTALFPFHLWLPPAHSGAPPAASALLSSLVVKGSFFITVRIWFDVMTGLTDFGATQILGAMGAGAIVVGGVMALRQTRLKLLIAYSTVAQLGYLFLMFPLAAGAVVSSGVTLALSAGMFQAVSHAFAKAAMFMAAGLVADAVGHDRIAELRGIGYQLPVTAFAFGIAALSLIGVPPTGGFFTKWLLLSASVSTSQWWWIVVVLAGGLLAGGYMFRVISPGLAAAETPLVFRSPVSRNREIIVLVLAIFALLIGMIPGTPLELLQVGRVHLTRAALP